ncbi:hypothetical protein F4778DRAFT_799554 [Xylariomycetidae sp. FL2044]|nr:hypothetical protein F4778DRAFT_799554 [Xylariomycetidae sp. FL2044]
MRTEISLLFALLGLSTAAPSPITDEDVELISRSFSPRDAGPNNQEFYRDYVPPCDEDPSYVDISHKSKHTRGDGKKLPKDGKDDMCTTGHNSDHCWTEYWFTETEIEYDNWSNSGAAIDCKSTSSCSSRDVDLKQTCTSMTKSKGETADWKAFDIGFEGKVWKDWSFKASDSFSYKWDHGETNGTTICTTAAAYNTCTWEDEECHQVWYATRNVRVYGYVARICNGKGKGGSMLNEELKDGSGKWIRGMADMSFLVPINKQVGCNAKCDSQKYTDPKPSEQGGRHAFEADW